MNCGPFYPVSLQDLSVENVAAVYELAETYHAQMLRQKCVMFTLEHHEEMCGQPG